MAGRRRSDGAFRGKLRSPGRPPVARREHRRSFWAFIAAGLSSEDAAMEVGVSQPVGFRWFREASGMPPSHLARSSKPRSGRQLSWLCHGNRGGDTKARMVGLVRPQRSRAARLASPRPGRSEACGGRRGGVES